MENPQPQPDVIGIFFVVVCICSVIQKTLSNINHLKDVYYIKTHYYVR